MHIAEFFIIFSCVASYENNEFHIHARMMTIGKIYKQDLPKNNPRKFCSCVSLKTQIKLGIPDLIKRKTYEGNFELTSSYQITLQEFEAD